MCRMLVVCLLGMASLLARAASDCRTVGGSISTNFVNATTTSGPATGDLAGAVGVSVLSVTQGANSVVFHNQHTWVTATGDTIFTNAADATAYPTQSPGFTRPVTSMEWSSPAEPAGLPRPRARSMAGARSTWPTTSSYFVTRAPSASSTATDSVGYVLHPQALKEPQLQKFADSCDHTMSYFDRIFRYRSAAQPQAPFIPKPSEAI